MGLVAQEFHDVLLGFPELEGVMQWAFGRRVMEFFKSIIIPPPPSSAGL